MTVRRRHKREAYDSGGVQGRILQELSNLKK